MRVRTKIVAGSDTRKTLITAYRTVNCMPSIKLKYISERFGMLFTVRIDLEKLTFKRNVAPDEFRISRKNFEVSGPADNLPYFGMSAV